MSAPYRVLDLVQGSDEWKNARFDHMTASQTPILFDLSDYQTRLQLFEEKLLRFTPEPSASQEILFQIGHKAEAAGRVWFEEHFGVKASPLVVVSTVRPELLASLDGFTADGVVFEAKYVGREALEDVKRGKIKPAHGCQVQAQLLVTGGEKCVYFAMDPNGDAATCEILPDRDYQLQIAEAAAQFMADLKEGREPAPSMRDYIVTEDVRFETLARMKQEKDRLEVAYKTLCSEIETAYAHNRRMRGFGMTMQRQTVKGGVDYSRVPQLKGVDLDRFRKESSERVVFQAERKKAKS